MTLKLTIASAAWRSHIRKLQTEVPGLVPVAKGNGYGFGLDVLAREAMRMKAPTLAVGIAQEVTTVRLAGWTRDVVVLNPWRPGDAVATGLLEDSKVIATVSRVEDLAAIRANYPSTRVILELDTSMHRHGLDAVDAPKVDPGALNFEGWAVHLPAAGSLAEATQLTELAEATHRGPMWLSHLTVADYRMLRINLGVRTLMRVGTRLWLGEPSALSTTATVLDVHPIKRGGRLGYHGHRVSRDGWIVVVSGGTAHGVALAAPVPQRSVRQRGVTVATGILEATGHSLSPFTISGKKRPFAEPPHMHSSMLFVPGATAGVEVGDEVPVTCRMTTTAFDEIAWT